MVATVKVKNTSPNTGSSCKSGCNGDWLRPTSTFGIAAVRRISLLVLAFVGLGFATSPADAAWYDTNWQFRKSIIIDPLLNRRHWGYNTVTN